MSKQKDSEFETYTIPPNFIEGSTLFGGLFKLRNAIEAGVLAIGAGLPVFLPVSYTHLDLYKRQVLRQYVQWFIHNRVALSSRTVSCI